MVTMLDHGTRKARKTYRCGLCLAPIEPGDLHAFQSNLYDGRVYTWRDCLACERDGILNFVQDWDGGWSDEGIDYEKASQWADEASVFRRYWLYDRPMHPAERLAARNFCARMTREE